MTLSALIKGLRRFYYTTDTLKNNKNLIMNAIKVLKSLKHENRKDFEGWEEKPKTFKDMLNYLQIEKDKNNNYIIKKDNKLLNAYIRILQDDGMGYGANNGSCYDIHTHNNGLSQDKDEIYLWF